MSFGYTMLGFGATQSDVYDPGMMTYDGSTGYYNKAYTASGDLTTTIARFNVASFSGGGIMRVFNFADGAGRHRADCYIVSNDFSTATLRDKLVVSVKNSTSITICNLVTDVDAVDAEKNLFFAFSGTAGTAILYINGVDADDTGHASRIAPTTGTLGTVSPQAYVGAGQAGASKILGDIGYAGHIDAYLTNPTDFYHPANGLQELDESGWTEWGAQPLFWNQYGTMTDNKGSAGNMTKNGTITGPA